MMWTIARRTLALALAATALAHRSEAIKVFVTNACDEQFQLAHLGHLAIISVESFPPGTTLTKEIPMGQAGHVFKAGTGAQATLAEIATAGGKVWFDISIIPTGPKSGPDYCPSLDACKAHTGGVGFNKPMQIAPQTGGNGSPTCRTITCMNDGCADGYQFPKDDTKTHSCMGSVDLQVTFCPGGNGGKTPAPTPSPTPPPTTQAPTTPVPSTTPESEALNEAGVLDFRASFAEGNNSSGSGAVNSGVEDRSMTDTPTDVPVSETPVPTTQAPVAAGSPEAEVHEANTRTSASTTDGTGIIVVASVGVAAAVAAAAIFVLRKKKKELEVLESKSPRPTTAVAATAFMLTTPQETTIL